jgi:putative endopeptidase
MYIARKITHILLTCALMTGLASAQVGLVTPKHHGIDVANMDRSVKPGNEWYEYCNGDWIKKTTIPPDRGSVGVFSTLFDLSIQRTSDVIREMEKEKASQGSEAEQVADLYKSYMDEQAIEKRGLSPLKPHLDAIAAIKDKRELARYFGESLRADVDPLNNTNFHTSHLFGLWVAPDFNDPAHYTAYMLQGGLVLPTKAYYLSDSPRMKQIRDKYKAHVEAMLKLAGFNDAGTMATRIIDLEHSIAEKHLSLAENEDVHKANNPWTKADFAKKAPGLDWNEYFNGAGLQNQQHFIVWQPTAFAGESALVASVPLQTWKDWLSYHLIEQYSGELPKNLEDERFAFLGPVLSGTPQQLPRWKRGVLLVDGILGDAVGKVYAKKYFSPEAKAQAQEMVSNLVQAFERRIDALTWMNPKTKAQAKEKLEKLYVGIGYPEQWHSYAGLEVKPGDLFGNVWRASLFHYHQQVDRLGKPVDRHEWSMTPQTVNAVNLPLQDALNFPAAILQPPFFDPKAPSVVNYGAIGSIIGHEISHTFDTEGSTFDAQGRMRDWWTPADYARFKADTAKLAAQYNTYKPFPDVSVNGEQTLAEDIADLAGATTSFMAYQASLHGKPGPTVNGFTADQQFFIAFGQNWANRSREAALRQQVLTDVHAPARYRSYEVRNVDDWYKAFDVKPDEKLYLVPDQRVHVW